MNTLFFRPRIALALLGVLALAAPAAAQVGARRGMLDPNLATEAELRALPGMSPALAQRVVASRPLLRAAQFDSLLAGGGLKPEARTAVYRRLWAPINLNTARRADILLIPGVGARMAHEFEEYRPYRNLAQFRREIGKYVDKAEVARLEQYVFVPIRLNTATDAEILSIPGVGRRMLGEFKEYRPYRNRAQFRREIGKYVNARELARLESYVVVQ